ncbi:MAG: protein kinase domain-containing protein [Verrucomicrobiota bacterium]
MLVQCANPSCGTKFPRPESDAGRIVMCPQCGKSTTAAPAKTDKPQLGQLGDYKIIRPVAKGGMGEVYEATQLRLGRSVALKVLNRNLAMDEQFLQRFEREAKAAAALNHPNIVHVYDFAHEDGQAYLVMEFIEGQDLAKIVSQAGKMPLKEGLKIVADVASALQEAHSKGIIHRDIKPANILLTSKGIVKVSDLGLARRLDDDSDLTATGAGIGTPHFMSPEQARDAHHVDHRADIYSLGITLLYLLTGKRPYEGKSSYSIVLAHSTEPLPSGLELGTELPAHVEALLHKMAAKKPEDRYADYATLLADIKRVQRGEMPEGKLGDQTSTQPIGMPKPLTAAAAKPNQPKPLEITATVPAATPPATNAGGESRFWQIAMAVGILCTAIISLVALVQSLKDKGPGNMPGTNVVMVNDGQQASSPPPQGGKSKELTEEDMQALQEMMEQQEKGKRYSAMMSAKDRPDPLPPLEPLDNPLKIQGLPEMVAEAEAYAKANPTKYRSILARYDQLYLSSGGTQYRPVVGDAFKVWSDRQMVAVKKEYESLAAEAKKLIQEQGHRLGMQVWQKFPLELRGDGPDVWLKERIQTDFPPPAIGVEGLKNKGPQ